jgi:hypothetical protein
LVDFLFLEQALLSCISSPLCCLLLPSGSEFLTGFHKRKVERKKAAIEEIKQRLKQEQKKLREEVGGGGGGSPTPWGLLTPG